MPKTTTDVGKDFDDLIDEIATGSETAATQLVHQYGPYILRAIRRSLRSELRCKFDSADFVQAVWTSFFDSESNMISGIRTPSQLISLLTIMARNKVIDEGRRRTTRKYDHRLERHMSDDDVPAEEARSREPTPSEFAIARERFDRINDNQTEKLKRIVNLRIDGLTYREIAERLGVSDKTVQRAVERMRRELENEEENQR